MAEKIVSPGVFTRERDLSFLPAGVAQIGAAIIGPTVKGPAFEPTIIESFKEFVQVFGPKTLDSYVPYTVESYLKSAGRVTVIRVLGLTGYTPNLIGIKAVESSAGSLSSAGGTSKLVAVLHPTHVDSDAKFNAKFNDGVGEISNLYFTGSGGNATGSFRGFFLTLSSPDPAGGAADEKFGFFFTGSQGVKAPQTNMLGNAAPTGMPSVTKQIKMFMPSSSTSANTTNPQAAVVGAKINALNLSGSIVQVIASAINRITSSRVPGVKLFSARTFQSSSTQGGNSGTFTSGTMGAFANLPAANSIEVRNKFTGNVANPQVGHDASLTQPVAGPATASFTIKIGSDSTLNGSIDGGSFTLYLTDDQAGTGVTTYSPQTNFTTGHTDTGNILTSNTTYSSSIDTTNENWLGNVFGRTPKDRYKPVYNYMLFNSYASKSYAADSLVTVAANIADNKYLHTYAGNNAYEARTPFIVSQNLGSYASPKTTRLFKVHTRSHGSCENYAYKIAISNIKDSSAVAGSDYGTFTLTLRRVDVDGTIHAANSPYPASGDKDLRPHILETYSNLTLDPNSPNFIARVIGDRYQEIDANGKVTVYGDYANLSYYIRVEVPEDVKDQGISADLVPFGFEALSQPVIANVGTMPSASLIGHTNATVEIGSGGTITTHNLKKTQIADNVYNKRIHYGFDYLDKDNYNYLLPIPSEDSTVGDNKHFNLSHCTQHPSASLANGAELTITPDGALINLSTKQFIVPLQGGFDGLNPSRFIAKDSDIVATNMQGFDLSNAEKGGSKAYKRAINAVSNPDEYDINLMVTPGPNHRLHSVVTTHAKNLCEDRGDALYLMDAVGYDTTTISTVTNTVKPLDSNYVATYWPWVKILDTDKNKPVWVPPSAVMAGVISKNDQVAFEWFAPAGLNRGILTEAIDVPTRLTHAERDDLYEGRVNPIATFKEGICIWGQKTLQARPSALDRINVRRLLIAAKKFIASATKYLVFENNTSATRNRFLNIANPYFESVQQRQGLYAYKVIMDGSNNTADVIDRNQMIGEIFLQPAKSAEFIILDFNILPTGAVFPE